ncbi:hypothetical protein POPTR_014G158501v4 [Populus trichocarpa]|uniref:Uncharacterized protein n=1 Tax=Populus trichocarpa TaxID=3694 RepID=A0ACC0RZK9_POPTR|nr:hypothetical protein BDE02_14G135900 [Populus trichocarpa]KAI9382644.1 hypothetical protein POPTR_014G158501v4 [Populus trichocarpa]
MCATQELHATFVTPNKLKPQLHFPSLSFLISLLPLHYALLHCYPHCNPPISLSPTTKPPSSNHDITSFALHHDSIRLSFYTYII